MEWILLVQTRNVGLVTDIPTAEYLGAWQVLGKRSFKPSKGTNLFILIILAGDIEMNPGPRFQCGLCKKYCKASDRLLECEECEKRFHAQTLVTTNS